MAKKIYVGNLSFQTNDDTLRHAFSIYGDVAACSVVIDRYTNSSKGFGFVEMSTVEEAKAAVDMFAGKELDGRSLTVNFAKPMAERSDRSNDRYPRRDRRY